MPGEGLWGQRGYVGGKSSHIISCCFLSMLYIREGISPT